jgi:hypothetical protein
MNEVGFATAREIRQPGIRDGDRRCQSNRSDVKTGNFDNWGIGWTGGIVYPI